MVERTKDIEENEMAELRKNALPVPSSENFTVSESLDLNQNENHS
jgi:hypothetical protein